MEKRVRQSSASEGEQRHFMVAFQEDSKKHPMTPYYKMECDWSTSLVDLYSFAFEHSSEIHVSNQKLLIEPKIFDEFEQENRKLRSRGGKQLKHSRGR